MPGIQWVLNKCWLNKRINEWVMWSDDTSLELWNPSHNIIRSRKFFFFFKAVSAPVRLSIYINCFQATVSSLPSLLSSLRKELWSKHVSACRRRHGTWSSELKSSTWINPRSQRSEATSNLSFYRLLPTRSSQGLRLVTVTSVRRDWMIRGKIPTI